MLTLMTFVGHLRTLHGAFDKLDGAVNDPSGPLIKMASLIFTWDVHGLATCDTLSSRVVLTQPY